jgi:predicted PurR-regulated permease PerM
VIQTIDGNVLGPKILGDRIGLSSFWVLFGILLFGGLFGFIGMLVGVPLFAVIYDILKKLIYYGLEKHGYELDTEVSGDTETAVICDEVDVQAQVNDMTEGNK